MTIEIEGDEIVNAVVPRNTDTAIVDQPQRAMTPMDMVYHVVQSGQPIEVVREMMALSREIKAEQAREAFDAAIANAKAEIKPVVRNKTGHNNKRYADFSAYVREIDPIITKFGLSYRFRTTQTDKISVTCIVSHRDGHNEENTLSGPADSSGAKNAIQAIGSTLTYLQRYTLTQALGLAASDEDDDGASSQSTSGPISEAQEDILRNMIETSGPRIDKFCGKWGIRALHDLPAAKFEEAVSSLTVFAREKAKRETEEQNVA